METTDKYTDSVSSWKFFWALYKLHCIFLLKRKSSLEGHFWALYKMHCIFFAKKKKFSRGAQLFENCVPCRNWRNFVRHVTCASCFIPCTWTLGLWKLIVGISSQFLLGCLHAVCLFFLVDADSNNPKVNITNQNFFIQYEVCGFLGGYMDGPGHGGQLEILDLSYYSCRIQCGTIAWFFSFI